MGIRQEFGRHFLIYMLLAAATVAVYWQVVDFDFVNFDDGVYVVDNPYVHAGLTRETVRWALTATYQCTWQPLTWMSYMLDATVGGIDPTVFHATNVVLHLANTFLVFWVLRAFLGFRWRAAFVAMLFAVHPMHVESVAWVAERKDVLSTLFWLLAMAAYLRYTRDREPRKHLTVVVLFALGLMAKPMVVTLPLVLLLLDYWPLGRFAREIEKRGSLYRAGRELVAEKMPLFVLSAASAGVTWYATYVVPVNEGRTFWQGDVPSTARIANAAVAYVAYLLRLFWPRDLAAFYPHPGTGLPVWQVIASVAVLAALSALAIAAARKKPYVPVGWFWYVISLFPASGITQVGRHGMADRFTYVPYIGLFIVLAWGLPDLLRVVWPGGAASERRRGWSLAVAAVIALSVLTKLSYCQTGHWRNSVTLFTHAVDVTRDNAFALHLLGFAYQKRGDNETAIHYYRKALKIEPKHPELLNDMGTALFHEQRFDEALEYFARAIAVCPKFPIALNNAGSVLLNQGRYREAIARFKAALVLDPGFRQALDNLETARSLSDSN